MTMPSNEFCGTTKETSLGRLEELLPPPQDRRNEVKRNILRKFLSSIELVFVRILYLKTEDCRLPFYQI